MNSTQSLEEELGRLLDILPADITAPDAYLALGDAGLFAVHYPTQYGGRGGTMEQYATVAEAIGDRELADEVHLVTVQGVGCTILWFGTDEQRERWLPGIASGRMLASLLLSERGAGSDAAAITTAAHRTATGWSLSGEKCWALHADWSGLGLCSARTSTSASRYKGITLFLVDLSAPGVTVAPLPRAIDEPYFTVSFDGVELTDADVLGTPDLGFPLVTAAAGFERAGFDYLTRGRVWLRAAEETLTAFPELATERRRAEVARLDHELSSARALAHCTVRTAQDMTFDYLLSAYSKYACGEAAQAVARWIGEDVLPEPVVGSRTDLVARLRAGVLEAPELSISGNAVDLLLDTISLDPQLGEPGLFAAAGESAGGPAAGSCLEWTRVLSRAAASAVSSEDQDAELVGPDRSEDPDRLLVARAAVSVGAAQRALVVARRRACTRTVAGRPLIEMQSTGHRLARAAVRLALARTAVAQAGLDLDLDRPRPGHQAPAVAAVAAEAAFAASHALVQVYGAAGTSDQAPVAAFEACQRAGGAAGSVAELWLEAGRRRATVRAR